MQFNLKISSDNLTYNTVDLFPEQQLEYDLDFYDSLDVSKIKLPFYTTLRIPLTDTNKSSNRFNFDPYTSSAGAFPTQDYFFTIDIYGSSTSSIAGILNVMSIEYNSAEPIIEVELKDYLSRYLSEIKDTKISELYTDNYYTSRKTMSTFLNTTASGGEAGIIGQNPDYTRPISFPYVDFCNDVDGKFGYAARQFTEYGTGMNRGGIAPVFSVTNMLRLIGSYVSSSQFPVRVDSSLFALGSYNTPAISEFEPEKLHLVTTARLLAKSDINTRNFFVRQAPAWVGTNQSLENCTDLNNDPKLIHTGYFGNMETAGNYGTDGEGEPLYELQDWGADKRANFYPDDNDEGIRGFFCPKVSFNSSIGLLSGGNVLTIDSLKYEIPVIGEDKMVEYLVYEVPQSTLRLKVYVGVYADGFMVKKIPLQDANGNDLLLDMDDVSSYEQGFSNKDSYSQDGDFFSCEDGDENVKALIGNGATWRDMLVFNTVEAHFPSGEEIMINSGSQYSINYFLEPFDGDISVIYVSDYVRSGTGANRRYTKNAGTQSTFSFQDIRKAITRIGNYGELNLSFTANQDYLPYKLSDEFVIKDSIEQSCEITLTQALSAILKRFECGLFYEYDSSASTHVLRIDPLNIVRSGNQNINQFVDDLKSVKITNGGDKVKTIEINNEEYGGFFDSLDNGRTVTGSTIQEINEDGIAEIKIDLESGIYYKSVCGDDASSINESSNLGAFSENELGFTTNIYTQNKDVGLRFAYLDKPLYKTNLLTPHATLKGFSVSDKMKTESQIIYSNSAILSLTGVLYGQHIFNGRLFNFNTAGWNLMFEKEDGTTGRAYTDIFELSEKITQSSKPTIEFDMVVPTSDLQTIDFFLQTLTASKINPNSILVKSAKGDVYEDYAYLTITGLLG